MSTLDVLTNSLLRCEVAREAERCRHSFLRNGFALLNDRALSDWLKDSPAMHELENSIAAVDAGIPQFSAVHVIEQIRPLADLPQKQLKQLHDLLSIAFEQEFRPVEVTERLRVASDKLLSYVHVFGANSSNEQIAKIRSAAATLLEEMKRLPAGFLLPKPSLTLGGANVD